jgi:hypothetical protein
VKGGDPRKIRGVLNNTNIFPVAGRSRIKGDLCYYCWPYVGLYNFVYYFISFLNNNKTKIMCYTWLWMINERRNVVWVISKWLCKIILSRHICGMLWSKDLSLFDILCGNRFTYINITSLCTNVIISNMLSNITRRNKILSDYRKLFCLFCLFPTIGKYWVVLVSNYRTVLIKRQGRRPCRPKWQ